MRYCCNMFLLFIVAVVSYHSAAFILSYKLFWSPVNGKIH